MSTNEISHINPVNDNNQLNYSSPSNHRINEDQIIQNNSRVHSPSSQLGLDRKLKKNLFIRLDSTSSFLSQDSYISVHSLSSDLSPTFNQSPIHHFSNQNSKLSSRYNTSNQKDEDAQVSARDDYSVGSVENSVENENLLWTDEEMMQRIESSLELARKLENQRKENITFFEKSIGEGKYKHPMIVDEEDRYFLLDGKFIRGLEKKKELDMLQKRKEKMKTLCEWPEWWKTNPDSPNTPNSKNLNSLQRNSPTKYSSNSPTKFSSNSPTKFSSKSPTKYSSNSTTKSSIKYSMTQRQKSPGISSRSSQSRLSRTLSNHTALNTSHLGSSPSVQRRNKHIRSKSVEKSKNFVQQLRKERIRPLSSTAHYNKISSNSSNGNFLQSYQINDTIFYINNHGNNSTIEDQNTQHLNLQNGTSTTSKMNASSSSTTPVTSSTTPITPVTSSTTLIKSSTTPATSTKAKINSPTKINGKDMMENISNLLMDWQQETLNIDSHLESLDDIDPVI